MSNGGNDDDKTVNKETLSDGMIDDDGKFKGDVDKNGARNKNKSANDDDHKKQS